MERERNHWSLVIYDLIIMLGLDFVMVAFYVTTSALSWQSVLLHAVVSAACVFAARGIGRIYQQIWRYGGIQCYIRLLLTDAAAFIVELLVEWPLAYLLNVKAVSFARLLSLAGMNLLAALAMRMMYRYAFKCGREDTRMGHFLRWLLRIFAGEDLVHRSVEADQKIKIAIIGAGQVGVNLAEELMANANANYVPRCFVDCDPEKAGRSIHGIPVFMESEETLQQLRNHEVQEVVFAIPNISDEKKKKLYTLYINEGYKVKVYDFPVMQTAGKKRYLREFDVEELLFRKPINISDTKTHAYYKGKVVLITGGGGSIGSELCRQLAKMNPRQIIILDIYENGAYDIQQELKIAYGKELDLQIEICSITNKQALRRVFERYHPQIVINAAAHKHVPLMEKNCVEAVYNNVFGTIHLVELCEEYNVERFMMVSTDKAVNPTNVMGATKRMCEMIVQSRADGQTNFSATRFGNVLGSNGSVIPLFKRQIMNGGPVTLTDKRIIRYFMTIPEAVQLVLEAGSFARSGEVFVLDMGEPVHILDLAEKLIRLSGYTPYVDIPIKEIGLRPGEKLYEELLTQSADLRRTENEKIFVEEKDPVDPADMEAWLERLAVVVERGSREQIFQVLHQMVPTFREPEEVNREVIQAVQNGRAAQLEDLAAVQQV